MYVRVHREHVQKGFSLAFMQREADLKFSYGSRARIRASTYFIVGACLFGTAA